MKQNKQFAHIRVLLMESSSRAALPMAKGFRKLGCEVTTVAESKMAVGILTKYSNNKIVIPEIESNEKIAEVEYLKLIATGNYDLVVPLSDFSATIASKHKKEWSLYGPKIAVNDWEVFEKIIDKSKTMLICEKNNIPSPKTLFTNNPIEEIKKGTISFPVVIKPKTGIGSIGFNIVHNEETLIKVLNDCNQSNGPLLVQEYIEQDGNPQYGAELFRDRDGIVRFALVAKVTRWYPVDGGSRLCSISIHDDEIVNNCIRLLDALDWNGYANIDLVWDSKESEAKILEINGRTGASVKLDFLSGVDVCRLIIENEFGLKVTNYSTYKEGKAISCFLVDCLWFLKSKDRFKSKPSWFARWKYKDVIFSWGDILPSFGFFFLSLKNFKKEMKKRKRIKNEK